MKNKNVLTMSIRARRFFLVIAICLLAVFLVAPARATTMKKLTPEELTADASVIVKGMVTNVTSQWEEDETMIYTYVTISVNEYLKSAGPKEVVIKQLGGTVDETALWVEGTSEFKQDEKVLLYLRSSIGNYFEVVGLSQGKFTVKIDPDSGREIIQSDTSGIAFIETSGTSLSQDTGLNEKGTLRQNDYLSLIPLALFLLFLPVFSSKRMRKKGFRRVLCLLPVGLMFLSLFPIGTHAFTLQRPTVDPHELAQAPPSAQPPFRNWDHRRFALGFQVPYSINQLGTPDLDDVTVVRPGPNGVLDTFPAGDDIVVGDTIQAGPNSMANTAAAGDDLQVVGFGINVVNAEFEAIVASFAAWQWVAPAIINFVEVTEPPAGRGTARTVFARDNWNVLSWVSTHPLAADVLGLTGVWSDINTGVILESDILFNDAQDWVVQNHGLPTPTQADVQTVAMHEIGHFIGLGHSAAPAIMDSPTLSADHTLHDDDENGANFLYTPDLGDAPDPRYPSLVHGGPQAGTLNDIPIFDPNDGAEHEYGIPGVGPAPAGQTPPPYQFEWLGDSMDNHHLEDEARIVDHDLFDDGVAFLDVVLIAGIPHLWIAVTISTAGPAGRYPPAMYLNAWIDWNIDGDWDDLGEWVIGAARGDDAFLGPVVVFYFIPIPVGFQYCKATWARFRLDWQEDAGQEPQPWTDPMLLGPRGQAAFGEVEDYHIIIRAPPSGIYLHAEEGLIDLWDPVCTYWQGLLPNETYGKRYHLDSWLDNCNDKLSPGDYVGLEEGGYVDWYRVENVTVTLVVEKKLHPNETMYIEYEGYIYDFPWDYPVCTYWKEVYPYFCNCYHLEEWYDDNSDGYLSLYDQIVLKKCTNETAEYRIIEVATDIIITPKTPPEPPVANKTHTPLYPYAGEQVMFDASSSYAPEGTIMSYTWNFGDNTPMKTEAYPITVHIYAAPGTYTVTLTVTNNYGLCDTINQTITVRRRCVGGIVDLHQSPSPARALWIILGIPIGTIATTAIYLKKRRKRNPTQKD